MTSSFCWIIADAPSVIAGSIVGAMVASSFHEILIHISKTKPVLLEKVKKKLDKWFGMKIVDTMITVTQTEQTTYILEEGSKGIKSGVCKFSPDNIVMGFEE